MIAELSAIQAATGSLKSAGEIVKAMIGMKITAEVQAKIIELQTVIMSAQSGAMDAQASQMELLQRVRELEGELVKLKDWEAEKERYEPQTFRPGVVVPALKQEAMKPGEQPHLLCPECYERGRKSIFQPTPETKLRYRVHKCPACKTELAFSYVPPTHPMVVTSRSRILDE
jgi:hypothetical protein